jgi:Zn-dependent metalloprotease/fibronectin type 3 domain-containing protein
VLLGTVILALLTTLAFVPPALAKKAPEGTAKFRPLPEAAAPGMTPLATVRNNAGAVTRMYNISAPEYQGTAEDVARSFLRDNTALFGMASEVSDLAVVSTKPSPSGTHVRFQQMIDGIPVYRSEVVVNLNREGAIRSVSNDYIADLSAPTQPKITSDEAYQAASQAVGIKGRLLGDPTNRLMILPKDGRGYLTYRVTIATEDPLGDWEVFVDAVSGQVVQMYDQMTYVEGTGKTFDPDPESTMNNPNLPDGNDADAGIPAGAYFTYPLHDLNAAQAGLYRLQGPWASMIDFESPTIAPPAIADPNAFIWTRNPDEFENVLCYWQVDNIQRWFQSLGINNANALAQEMDAHGLSGADNSHFIPSTHRIAYGDGGVDDAEDADVVLHEYGHAITYDINPSWGGGQMGAMGEGYGDYVAGSYSYSRYPSYQNSPPFVFNWDGHNEFWAGRQLVDTSLHYPENATGDIYIGGTLWCSATYSCMQAVGRSVMDALMLDHQFAQGPSATMEDAANFVIQSDMDMFGGVHVGQLVTIFDQWGMLNAEEFVPNILHTPLGDTEDTIGPYVVTAVITSVQPLNMSSLFVYWGTGAGFPNQVALAATGNPNEYSASIPGQPNGAVNYYITASDTQGGTATHPTGAPANFHSFNVGADAVPPVIVHSELGDQTIMRWPATVRATVTDNLGVASVLVEWQKNGIPMTSFTLTRVGVTDVFTGEFNTTPAEMVVGDYVQYRVLATDASSQSNQTYSPVSGYYDFNMIDALGVVLVINDDDGLKTNDEPKGPEPERDLSKIGESAAAIAQHLTDLGYLVDTASSTAYDPGMWGGYDFIVSSSGIDAAPLSNATYRADLEAFSLAGGKILVEGGEVGYDAISYPGYPTFAANVLHAGDWNSDNAGALGIGADRLLHPIYTTPNQLPASIPVTYTAYGSEDANTPTAPAYRVYGTVSYPNDAGVLVYDDTPNPVSAQIVFWCFNFVQLADQATRNAMLENTAAYLSAAESAPTGGVSGHVDLTDTANESGVTVHLTGLANQTIVTGPDGNYSFTGLYSGNYNVTASKAGYFPYSQTTPVPVGTTVVTGVDFVFDPIAPGTVSGVATLSDNPDATGITVSIGAQGLSDVTGSDGVYQLTGVQPGDLLVVASKDGYTNESASLNLPNGGSLTGVNFVLDPGSNEFFEDFEADNGAFTTLTGGWEWGVSTTMPTGAYSGVNVWGTILTGNYPVSCNYTLDSPAIDLSGWPYAVLEFRSWYDTEAYYDGGNIKVSTDGGGTWQLVTPIGGYPEDAAYSGNAGIPNEPCFSGHIGNAWELIQVDLTAFVGSPIMIRWHFGSDSSVEYSGWSIDDVRVKPDVVKLAPENLTATGGLENHVPLAWNALPLERSIIYGQTDRMSPDQLQQEMAKNVLIPPYGAPYYPQQTNVNGYWVYRAPNSGGPYTKISTLQAANLYDDTNVTNGTPYFYVVTGDYGGFGESSFSNEANATPLNNPPAVPQNLTVVANGADALLDWDDNTDYDFAGYKVYKSFNYEPFYLLGSTAASTFSDPLGGDGVYRYRVTAYDLGGAESGPSNMASLLYGFLPPENLQAQSGNDGHVPLSWQHPGSGTGQQTLNVLLVSDQTDGSVAPEYYDSVYTTAFTEYGTSYTVWDHDVQGEPALSDLQPFNVIFWITGVSGGTANTHATLSLAEEATLVQWLQLGGKNLVLSGFWIGWDCIADATNQVQIPSDLFDNYMQVTYPAANFSGWIVPTNSWVLSGQGGPIGGSGDWPINWVSAESYPDMYQPATGSASGIFAWNDGAATHEMAGIQTDGGTFKTVMLGCPVEQIGTADEKNLLVANILNWFSGLNYIVKWKMPHGQGGNAVAGNDAAFAASPRPHQTHGTQRYEGRGKPVVQYSRVAPGYYYLGHWVAVQTFDRMFYYLYRSLTTPVAIDAGHKIAQVAPNVTALDDWGPGGNGLVNGTTYHYVAVCDYEGGPSGGSNEAAGTPVNLPPAMPTGLVANVVGLDVNLDWADNGDYDFASYSLDRLPNGGVWGEIASGLTSSSFVDNPGTGIWKYRVRAMDDGGLSSEPTAAVTALVGALPPNNLVARSGFDGHVPLTWMSPGTLPEYEISYDDDSAEDALALNAAGNGIAVRMTPLGYPAALGKVRVYIYDYSAPTTPYLVRVYDDDGPGGVGGTMLAEVQTNAEIGNSWVEVDFTALNLTFNDGDLYVAVIWITGASPGPTNFVGLDTNGSFEDRSWLVLDSGATWSQDELHTYFPNSEFMVRCTLFGPSKAAIETQAPIARANMPLYDVKPEGPASPISETANLRVSSPYRYDEYVNSTEPGEYYTLGWDPNEIMTDPTGYRLYRSLTAGVPTDPGHMIADLGVVTSYDDWAVTNGMQYFYVVTAVYPTEESGPSNEDDGIPVNLMPAAPTNLVATVVGDDVNLDWDDNADYDFASYSVDRLPNGGVWTEIATGLLASSYTDAPGDGMWSYRVRAVDTGGLTSDPSNIANAPVGPLPPNNLTAFSNFDGHVPLAWMAPGTLPEYEISYDDDSAENALALNAAGNGIAVRMTPLGYPATLGKVRVYIYDYSAPTTPYLVRVYDDDGPGGVGGTMLAEVQTNAEIGNTWVEVDLTALNLSFNDGDLYVAVIWITGASPGPTCYVGLDTNGSFEDRSWLVLTTGWDQSELHTYFPNSEFMVRCTLFGPSKTVIEAQAPVATSNMPTFDLKPYDSKPYDVTRTNSLKAAAPYRFDQHENATAKGPYFSLLYDPNSQPLLDPLGYRLYRSPTAGVPRDLAHRIADLGNVTTFDDLDVTNGVQYFYVATAVYPGDEESGPSNEDDAVPQDVLAPAPPSNLVANYAGSNVYMTWTDPTTNADGTPIDDLAGIQIFRNDVQVATAPAGQQYYTDVAPGAGTLRYYVRAYDEVPNVSDPSNLVTLGGYAENFEATNGGYTQTQGTVWEWGTPSGAGPGGAHGGLKCWGTTLAGNYPNNAIGRLQTIALTLHTNSMMEFWHWYNMESYWDGGNVKISTNGGTTWTIIDPVTPYPEDAASTANAAIPGERCYSASSGGWVLASFNLGAYGSAGGTSALLRFDFGSDGSVVYPGWYIDDILVTNVTALLVDAPDVKVVPATADLLQNSPNPFNPVTKIRYGVPASGHVRLAIFNLQGQLVRTLVDGAKPAGYDEVVWDGKNQAGGSLSSGVYLYRLETVKGVVTRKMMMLK